METEIVCLFNVSMLSHMPYILSSRQHNIRSEGTHSIHYRMDSWHSAKVQDWRAEDKTGIRPSAQRADWASVVAHPGSAYTGHQSARDQLRALKCWWPWPKSTLAWVGLFWYTDEQLQYFCVFSGGIVCVGIDSNIAQVYWTSSFMPSFPHVYLPTCQSLCNHTHPYPPSPTLQRKGKKISGFKSILGFLPANGLLNVCWWSSSWVKTSRDGSWVKLTVMLDDDDDCQLVERRNIPGKAMLVVAHWASLSHSKSH